MSQGYYLTKVLSELFQKLSWREGIHYMLFMMLLETSQKVYILATYTYSFRHFPLLVPCLLYREKFMHHRRKEGCYNFQQEAHAF